jgi:hypothetical protein
VVVGGGRLLACRSKGLDVISLTCQPTRVFRSTEVGIVNGFRVDILATCKIWRVVLRQSHPQIQKWRARVE